MNRRKFLKTSLAAAAGAVLSAGSGVPLARANVTLQNGSVFNQAVALNGFFTGSQIMVQYQTPSGNMPNTYGNVLSLWQASQLPYGAAPLMTSPIATNSSAGSQFFAEGLSSQLPYVVGYATSSDMTTVCSTLTFFPGRTDGVPFSTQIHPAYIGPDSMVVSYQTPPGNQPAANRNWVGLWQGSSARYDGADLLAKTMVSLDNNQDSVAINNVPLQRGTTYTAAYFIGEKNSDLAASFTMAT